MRQRNSLKYFRGAHNHSYVKLRATTVSVVYLVVRKGDLDRRVSIVARAIN